MVKASLRSFLTLVVSLAACLATACTTLRPVALGAGPQQIQSALHPGDEVRVVTRSGVTHALKVTTVGSDSLGGTAVAVWGANPDPVGARIDVPYADIAELEVRRTSGLKTAGLIGAVVVAVLLIASGGGSHDVGYGNR